MLNKYYISGFCSLLLLAVSVLAESTINDTHRWSWSSGAGWMNWRSSSTNGVVVSQYYLSGWIYSSTCGWIHTGDGQPTNGVQYTNASSEDYGVNHDGEGHLSGYAWCESTGWINFGWTNNTHADAPRIDLGTGDMSGYAWGGSLGWISLTNMSAHVKTDKLDVGQIADNGLPLAWQILMTGSTNILAGGDADYDGDGLTDYQEFIAGTHPTNSASKLNIAEIAILEDDLIRISWDMAGGRIYQVQTNANLLNTNGWGYVFPAWINSGTGGVYEADLEIPTTVTSLYYRVRVALPLSQPE